MSDRSAKHSDRLFDDYAHRYHDTLVQSLAPTGENKDYFAHGRIDFLKGMLARLGYKVNTVVDFGCGTGSTVPLLLHAFDPQAAYGVDVSPTSIETARREIGSDKVRFELLDQSAHESEFDLAYVNGVFHHIPLTERAAGARWIYEALKPGAYLAFWENNSWNPGTRWLMHRCAFDDDAIPISPLQAKRLLKNAGFDILRTDYLFIFPRTLRWLRWTERPLSRLPLGGQYQVFCRKRV